MKGLGKEAFCLLPSLFKPLQGRLAVHTATRGINPGYDGAMHCCKSPLWGRRLGQDYLNLVPSGLFCVGLNTGASNT